MGGVGRQFLRALGCRSAVESVCGRRVSRCGWLGPSTVFPVSPPGSVPASSATPRCGRVTRAANPANEAELVELARNATGAQLERVVQGYLGVIRVNRERGQLVEEKQRLSCTWGDDGMLRIEGRLNPEDGAALLKGAGGGGS